MAALEVAGVIHSSNESRGWRAWMFDHLRKRRLNVCQVALGQEMAPGYLRDLLYERLCRGVNEVTGDRLWNNDVHRGCSRFRVNYLIRFADYVPESNKQRIVPAITVLAGTLGHSVVLLAIVCWFSGLAAALLINPLKTMAFNGCASGTILVAG
ncbi:hypothetical protein M434DRAFT_39105 [Hypoxylon sp. CO27-5]|nr:hypothetical protein M434DRAFT_39105 [Hypoxylon sp. CO27-5]